MIEITVSSDNFASLMDAHTNERIIVKHKNIKGEVCLQKLYSKKPADTYTIDTDCASIETLDMSEFSNFVNGCMTRGYKVSSTDCSVRETPDGPQRCWAAILIKE